MSSSLASSVPGGRLVIVEGGHHNLYLSEAELLAEEINVFLRTRGA